MKVIYYIFKRKQLKWLLLMIAIVLITAAHFTMYYTKHDEAGGPTWEFTMTLHSVILIVGLLLLVWYKKYFIYKLMNHEK